MSTCPEVQKSTSLNLSWPQSVQYHIDEARPAVSNTDGRSVAEPPDTVSPTPVTTYNGVPRELLRKAQTLIADEIRVLDLRRGTREDLLVGSLRKVRLSDPIVYEPLSYTWTDYDDTKIPNDDVKYETTQAIFLENSDTFMDIGTNCEKALRSVRKHTTERTIWVDAICVNQDDPEERSRQVDLMRRIFARAFTVLVYLGQESKEHDSSTAISLLGQPDRLRNFDGLDHHEISSLTHLFERPYFRRMWIVQEVALAPTLELHCGPAITYLSAFAEKPLEAIFGSGIAHPPWLKHSKHAAGSMRSAPTTAMSRAEHVLRLLFDTVSCSCKDDRDRVFALLSLLYSGEEEWLRADYNLSTTEVYTGIAAFLATDGLTWAVLMLAPRLAENGHSDLPSWVPNWKMLGNAALEEPELLDQMIMRSKKFKLVVVSSVTRSGAITVRGKILGPITASNCDRSYMGKHRDRMRRYHELDTGSLNEENMDPGISTQRFRSQFIWTLNKPAESPFDDSWECHIESGLRRKPPSNSQYLAVMLGDLETVLVLRQGDSPRDQYTLVESGMPLVWGVIPRDRAWDDDGRCIEIPLQWLSRSTLEDCRLYDIPLPPELFPRLREYSHLWGYNPATSRMSLKHMAIEKILSTGMIALDAWLEWEKQAHVCVKMLRDERCLQSLIVRLHGLEQADYQEMEIQAGLRPSWSLDQFLGLLVKDPLNTGSMEWPHTRMEHGQLEDYEETAALAILMRWAAETYRFLLLLRPQVGTGVAWLVSHPHEIEDPFPGAMAVGHFHRLTAPFVTDGHETRDSERAAFLLRRILHQSSESTGPLRDQARSISSVPRLYWDWRKFESYLEEELSLLRHVRPDIENLRSYFKDSTPDLRHADAHELLAAHGVDLRREYTDIRIK